MGMTIEEFEEYAKSHNILTMTKDFYENRLKADMVAMLEEIQAQIDDLWEATWNSDYRGGFKDGCIESNNIIQQKINSLKEAKDENEH